MKTVFLCVSASLLALAPLACSGTSNGGDGNTAPDDGGPGDAQPTVSDAGPDGTLLDGTSDGATNAPSDGGEDADSSTPDASKDAAIDCAAVIAKIMGAAASPPNEWLGLDLSNDGKWDGGLGSGGLTIEQADILACASSVEPDVLEAGSTPFIAGGRTAMFVADDGGGAFVTYNLESHVIWFAETSVPGGTTLSFHSRPGGSYSEGAADGGSNRYVIGFGAGEDGGAGYVTKNGHDFPADWTSTTDDAGVSYASAWANEIYDGLMATYAPSEPAVKDCLSTPFAARTTGQLEPACIFSNAFGLLTLGVRPLGVVVDFQTGNHVSDMYEAWPGGYPSCATPEAAVDSLDYAGIFYSQNQNPAFGPLWMGASIGVLAPADPLSNSAGLLASEANRIAGCGGVTVTAPDPGYSAEQWGASGEVELEYNADSGVAYKLYAKSGYKGTLGITAGETDGGMNQYVIAPGILTSNGSPVALDWTSDAGTLNATITDISNAWLSNYCGVSDTDCVQAGDCAIVPDDGAGHSTFTLMTSAAFVPSCGDMHPLTFVFPKGASIPSEIYATNPGGK